MDHRRLEPLVGEQYELASTGIEQLQAAIDDAYDGLLGN